MKSCLKYPPIGNFVGVVANEARVAAWAAFSLVLTG